MNTQSKAEELAQQLSGVDYLDCEVAYELRRLEAENSALRAENERITNCLKKANDQAEDFERRWYLVNDELAAIKALEPVAHLWQHGETGRTRVVMPAMITDMVTDADASWQPVGPLYAIPKEPKP